MRTKKLRNKNVSISNQNQSNAFGLSRSVNIQKSPQKNFELSNNQLEIKHSDDNSNDDFNLSKINLNIRKKQ